MNEELIEKVEVEVEEAEEAEKVEKVGKSEEGEVEKVENGNVGEVEAKKGKEIPRVKFLMFEAIISSEVDRDGNFIIKYKYSRKGFPIEDLGKSMRAFEAHILQDIKEI